MRFGRDDFPAIPGGANGLMVFLINEPHGQKISEWKIPYDTVMITDPVNSETEKKYEK